MKNLADRREWKRLPLAIPVFVRGTDKNGEEFLDFSVALNVSGGGALLVCRQPLSRSARLSLEMPSTPLPRAFQLQSPRSLKARVIRTASKDSYNLYALRFNRPLI
ncbi:MAG: PilZ domain-containing protein [Acidobacteriia bacterium]|nr:PilZ domain-containing protein [Terriglobia bacterium]